MENPWLNRRVLGFAHQGGAKEAPSSTPFAIERALEAGADGVLICCHDDTVDATTNGSGAIKALSVSEVTSLDAAYRFVPGLGATVGAAEGDCLYRGLADADPRFRPSSLEAILEAFPGVPLNLDIKATAPKAPPTRRSSPACCSPTAGWRTSS